MFNLGWSGNIVHYGLYPTATRCCMPAFDFFGGSGHTREGSVPLSFKVWKVGLGLMLPLLSYGPTFALDIAHTVISEVHKYLFK
jgi:hypothetical protein